MKKIKYILLSLFMPLALFGQYASVGTDSTIDVMTWNIENFPKESGTVAEVQQIISDLDVDVIAVQEIADEAAFNQMLDGLSGWAGLLSPHEYSPGNYQKLGLIYNENEATVQSWQLLFENAEYAFPRPPLEIWLSVNEGGHFFDCRMIIVHLKAYEDPESEERRKAAMDSLKAYIDAELALGGEQDFILLGDFNDHLEDEAEHNIFQPMLDDDDYSFLTQPLVGLQGSYIGYNEPNLIDHICVTADALDEYGPAGDTQVLYLDQQNSSYEATVSDHRPVVSLFAFDNASEYTAIADIHEQFNDYQGQIVTIKGVVTIGAGIFSTGYTSVYVQDESDAGINIYYASGLIEDFEQGAEVEVTGEVADYNGLHEIKYHSHVLLQQNQPLPEAYYISTNSINDVNADPGRWVLLEGIIESIETTGGTSMMVNDGSGAGKVYIDPDAGLDLSGFHVNDRIRVTGVKTVYNYQGEVMPGYQEDLINLGASMVDEYPVLAHSAMLYQNYPNPFGGSHSMSLKGSFAGRVNPVTNIRFWISEPEYVTLMIYNAAGQKITTLLNEQTSAGYHSVQWDASAVAGGIYFYTLATERGDNQIRKMLLLR